jgi:hypothetical protein
MQSIKPGNQIWLATHNAEVIDEAGRDRVTYVTRNSDTRKSVLTAAVDEVEAVQKLRDLFGYSGFIGIAKSMVFLEGIDTSADRKTFSNLFPNHAVKVKFIPAQSTGHLQRLNSAILSILESNLGWMQFYLIRDRDYLTDELAAHYTQQGKGRLYVLQRCHIENYLLDEELLSRTLKEIFNIRIAPVDIASELRQICMNMAGDVLRDMLAFRLNIVFQAEDFSLGKVLQGESVLDQSGNWHSDKIELLKSLMRAKVDEVNIALAKRIEKPVLDALVAQCCAEIDKALAVAKDEWKVRFPGKAILEVYAKKRSIGKPIALINSLIKELATTPGKIPVELTKVVDKIAAGLSLAA